MAENDDALPTKNGDESASPIFILVMDGWSREEFRDDHVNLRDLTRRSFVFREACSTGTMTYESLPTITHQCEPHLEGEKIGTFVRPDGVASIFQMAHERDYQTALVGHFYPYHHIFGDELDYCVTLRHDPMSRTNLLGKMGILVVRNLRYHPDRASKQVFSRLWPRIYSRNWYAINIELEQCLLELVRKGPSNLFCFVHAPLPHWPFVFNSDGTYYGHWDREGCDECGSVSRAGYARQVQQLDRFVGHFVDALREAGRFDESLIVITSDHSSKVTTGRRDRRVPLIIKLPGQKDGHIVDTPLGNNEFGPVLEAVMRDAMTEERMLDIIHDSAAAGERTAR